MDELEPCPCCGGEGEIYSFYSAVYERMLGFAQCKQCGFRVWGKVEIETCDADLNDPGFIGWKRRAYAQVEKSICDVWNRRAKHETD